MAGTYRVVFAGKFAEGQERSVVRERLLRIFQGNQAAVDLFFTGRPVIVKDQLELATARKFQALFAPAGVPTTILPPPEESLELTMEAPPEPVAPAAVAEPRPPRPAPPPRPLPPAPPAPAAAPSMGLNLTAGLVILLIFASLGLRFWAANRLDHFVSLDHVSVNGERVALHAAGRIYLATPSGKLEQVLELADLGITGPVADLEVLNDGSLLVGDLEMKKILRCDPVAKSCQPFAPTGDFTLAENFKFLADQERGLLYIADTNNDRLLVQNLDDATCALAGNTSRLSYPNDLARGAGDQLYLCDTNHCRIIPLRVERDEVTEMAEPLPTLPAGLPVSPEEIAALAKDPERLKAKLADLKENLGQLAEEANHAKPFALALGEDGNLWAAQLNTVMTDGAIKIISPQGKPVGAISLAAGAVPVDLVRFSGGFLAVDAGLIKAYTIDPGSRLASDYGDQEFRQAMADIAGRRAWLENFKRLGLVATCLFALLALGVMVSAKRQGMA